MNLNRILKIIIALIGVVCAYFLVKILLAGDDAIESDIALQNGLVSPFLVVGYIVFGITTAIALVFTVLNLFKTPALLKKALIGVGAFIVIVVISFVLSKSEVTTVGDVSLSASGSKWVSTGLMTFYFLIVIAVGLIAYTGIRKAIK